MKKQLLYLFVCVNIQPSSNKLPVQTGNAFFGVSVRVGVCSNMCVCVKRGNKPVMVSYNNCLWNATPLVGNLSSCTIPNYSSLSPHIRCCYQTSPLNNRSTANLEFLHYKSELFHLKGNCLFLISLEKQLLSFWGCNRNVRGTVCAHVALEFN